jgi:N-methylhydantoinase B
MGAQSRAAARAVARRRGRGRRQPETRGRRPRVDPVVTEIVRNGVIAVTEEMKTNLMRTAYNIIIYEALDFTTGLFTPRGETISIGIGLPMFIRGMAETVKAKIRHFGTRDIRPGDIYITNDSYLTGSHLNHVTLTLPVFHAGELVAFSCCMAHWLDIGGILGGMSTDIYSEGLQIPILKYQDRGEVNQTVVEFIRQNVRLPSRAMGDLRAQVTAVKTGERGFLQLLDRYGKDQVLGSIAAIMDHSEVMARARTRTIPDGSYEAESFMDDDGIDIGKRVPIRVRVVVAGDEMTIDLSEVSKQVRGFYNSGITTGHACAQVAYKCLTSPTDYPINDGSFRSLETIVPPGRVISAVRPAPMRWWMTYPMTIVDTIFKALAPAVPGRVIAGHHADLLASSFHGINNRTSEFFIGSFGPLGGGWGAKMSEDGVSGTVCINDGDTHNSPNEQAEFKFPIVVERYALVPDSGGAGRRRGGLGVERVVRARTDMMVNNQSDRAHCRPWGLDGGLEAAGNAVELRIDGRWKTDFPNAKVLVAQLEPGDAFKIRSGGGGGYGSPLERPVDEVENDVRQGYVTLAAALELYGVVIDPETFEADPQATEKLRAAKRSTADGAEATGDRTFSA